MFDLGLQKNFEHKIQKNGIPLGPVAVPPDETHAAARLRYLTRIAST